MEAMTRRLRSEDWPEAARLVGRAIFDEPYMKVAFGEDPVARFVQVSDLFRGFDGTSAGRFVIGAYAGGHLLAVARTAEPGACRFCQPPDPDEPPSDHPFDVAFREVDPKVTTAHSGLSPHWYVAPMASEPAVQGRGLGRMVMEALISEAMLHDPAPMTLECAPHMVGFYERFGFVVIADVSAGAIDLRAMLRDTRG